MNLTAAQTLALNTAAAVATPAAHSDSVRAAANKIRDLLDPGTRRRAADLSQRVWVDVGPGTPRRAA